MISTWRKGLALLGMALLLTVFLSLPALALSGIQLDAEKGTVTVDDTVFALRTDVEKSIGFERYGDTYVAYLFADEGDITVVLGTGEEVLLFIAEVQEMGLANLAIKTMAQDESPRATLLPAIASHENDAVSRSSGGGKATAQSTSTNPSAVSVGDNCAQCGKSLSTGSHKRLPCGHFACRVKSGHVSAMCSFCGKYLCNGQDHTHQNTNISGSAVASDGSSYAMYAYHPGYVPGKGLSESAPHSPEEARLVQVLNEIERIQALESPTDEDKAKLENLFKEKDAIWKKIRNE